MSFIDTLNSVIGGTSAASSSATRGIDYSSDTIHDNPILNCMSRQYEMQFSSADEEFILGELNGAQYWSRHVDPSTGEMVTDTYDSYPGFSWGAVTQSASDALNYRIAYQQLTNLEGADIVMRDPSTNIFWVAMDTGEIQFYDVDSNYNPVRVNYNSR